MKFGVIQTPSIPVSIVSVYLTVKLHETNSL